MTTDIPDASEHKLADLILEYGELLDNRQIDKWLALLADDVTYRAVMRGNHDRSAPFFLINEASERLLYRIEAYRDEPDEPSLHLFSNVRITSCSKDRGQGAAAVLIFRTGRLAFSGRYFFEFAGGPAQWKIAKVTLVIEGETAPEIIRMPV
jgi:3-phenylpropionate/cinnamic acid dioxygenase small subunit